MPFLNVFLGGVQSVSDNSAKVKASSGGSYKCNAPQTLLKKGTTSLDVKNFQAGAFSPDKDGSGKMMYSSRLCCVVDVMQLILL